MGVALAELEGWAEEVRVEQDKGTAVFMGALSRQVTINLANCFPRDATRRDLRDLERARAWA